MEHEQSVFCGERTLYKQRIHGHKNLLRDPFHRGTVDLEEFHGKDAVAVERMLDYLANIGFKNEMKESNRLPSARRLIHLCGGSTSIFVSKVKKFIGFLQVLNVEPL